MKGLSEGLAEASGSRAEITLIEIRKIANLFIIFPLKILTFQPREYFHVKNQRCGRIITYICSTEQNHFFFSVRFRAHMTTAVVVSKNGNCRDAGSLELRFFRSFVSICCTISNENEYVYVAMSQELSPPSSRMPFRIAVSITLYISRSSSHINILSSHLSV